MKVTETRLLDTDVLIVGAGGTGLTDAAAIASFAPDLRVTLLERDLSSPCNSAIASNFIPAAGTRFQRAAGIEDTPELLLADILKKNIVRRHVSVTHQRSGLKLADVASFVRAVEVCKVLGAFPIDWTLAGTELRDMTDDVKPARAYLNAVHVPTFPDVNVSLFEQLLNRSQQLHDCIVLRLAHVASAA